MWQTGLKTRLERVLKMEKIRLKLYLRKANQNPDSFEARAREINVKKFNKKIRELKARIKKSEGAHK